MYIKRLRQRYFAIHEIPAELRGVLGRRRFKESLKTDNEQTAKLRAGVFETKWRTMIEQARAKRPDHIPDDAAFWRDALREAVPEHRDTIKSFIGDHAQEMVERAAMKAGITDHRQDGYDALPIHEVADRFLAIATGKLVPLDEHLDEYLATLRVEQKTKDMRQATIRKFCQAGFPFVADVQRKTVQRWLNDRGAEGWKPATIQRAMSELRGYWAYLHSIEAAPEDALPFDKLTIPNVNKNAKADERRPFETADVVKLHMEAKARGDGTLADLIELGMWTGARIEELCALKVEKVGADYIDITDAKTVAGWRQVPVHSKLKDTLARLVKDSKDTYVLSGLSENKYGDRSNAVGKRFGRLKTDLGYGAVLVFHSIRKTVATLLENAGVLEGVAADILGHDKPGITFGLYSGGNTLETKRAAVERLSYPARQKTDSTRLEGPG